MPAGACRPDDSPPHRVAVAASGGLDSTALLHCTARVAAALGVEVHALHVHHGLQPEADKWMRQVAGQCRRWSRAGHPLRFHAHRVKAQPGAGESVEAWARKVRYQALAAMARDAGCGLVLLAHHRRDQAETFLLQALRGAGPAGLAAMPAEVHRDGLNWVRPWLDQPQEAIAAYARRWRLTFVSDPSNADPRLARGRLRVSVWPRLLDAFGDAETALSAAARRASEAREIVDEIARQDVALVCDAAGLDVAAWLDLTPARRANVLRHWLGAALPAGVPDSLVRRMLRELPGATLASWPAAQSRLRLHRGRLSLCSGVTPSTGEAVTLDLARPGRYVVPGWSGALSVEPADAGGVPASSLLQVEWRSRRPGDQFQLHDAAPPRSLKKQFQEMHIAPWLRSGPVLAAAAGVVFVAGLGVDARARRWPGSPRLTLRWEV